jgi:hypothetical protein
MYDYVKCKDCLCSVEVYEKTFECRINSPVMDHKGYACWPRLTNLDDGCYEGIEKLDKEIIGE